MEEKRIFIRGGNRLEGEVWLSGAKNAALPCIVAACLGEEPTELLNVPICTQDIQVLLMLLESLGANIEIDLSNKRVVCSRGNLGGNLVADKDLACKIRVSLLVLGLATALRFSIMLPQPGGCQIGDRKYDLHLMGLSTIGASIKEEEGLISLKVDKDITGSDISFYLPTTTGTENVIIGSVLGKGKTLIRNANTRPEVMQLGELLNKMGARVKIKSRIVEIEGVNKIKGGISFTIMPGWDEAVSYIIATAATNGEIMIHDFSLSHIREDVRYLSQAGLEFFEWKENVFVNAKSPKRPFDLFTAPYPGVNSDMQPLFSALAVTVPGVSTITDLRFTDRFTYISELKKFGADIDTYGNCAVVNGGNQITGSNVTATDLRGGMACIIVGLAAEGTTSISNVYQIQRGYENVIEKITGLGGEIWLC